MRQTVVNVYQRWTTSGQPNRSPLLDQNDSDEGYSTPSNQAYLDIIQGVIRTPGVNRQDMAAAELRSDNSGGESSPAGIIGSGNGNANLILGFMGFKGLTEITIPGPVTSIECSDLCNCRSLTQITIPSSVTSIGDRAFWSCPALQEITIPSSVTSIEGSAFEGCSALKKITIPSSVTSIGDRAFWGCPALQEITIPSSVTSIGRGAFENCYNLTQITLPTSFQGKTDLLGISQECKTTFDDVQNDQPTTQDN